MRGDTSVKKFDDRCKLDLLCAIFGSRSTEVHLAQFAGRFRDSIVYRNLFVECTQHCCDRLLFP